MIRAARVGDLTGCPAMATFPRAARPSTLGDPWNQSTQRPDSAGNIEAENSGKRAAGAAAWLLIKCTNPFKRDLPLGRLIRHEWVLRPDRYAVNVNTDYLALAN